MVFHINPQSIQFQSSPTPTGVWGKMMGAFHVVKDAALGFYKLPVGIGTVVNLYRFPNRPLSEQSPRFQRWCEYIGYLCGLNSTYPHVTEFHLATSPIRVVKVKIPGTEYTMPIPLPKTPVVTDHVVQEELLVRKLLQKHRNAEHFDGSSSLRTFFHILDSIFPNSSFASDDFFLTCGPTFSEDVRAWISRTLRGVDQEAIIQMEADKLCKQWKTYAWKTTLFDVTKETRLFTCSVITHILLGESRDCQDLAEAVYFINEYIFSQVVGVTPLPNEERRFQKACQIFREVIEEILAKDPSHLFPKAQFEMTLEQKRAQLFGMFFAGEVTTAFALDHLISKVALKPDLYRKLISALQTQKTPSQIPAWCEFIEEGLLENPPVYSIRREAKRDSTLSFQTANGLAKKRMRQGEGIIHEISVVSQELLHAKRCGRASPQALTFRVNAFGTGAHACLGERLARKEIDILMSKILSQFEIYTSENEFISTPKVTKHSRPFKVIVAQRQPAFSLQAL